MSNGTETEQQAQATAQASAWLDELVLRYRELPDLEFAIEGFLPIGLTILFAGPFIGKSYFAQQLEHLMAYGRPLGELPIPAEPIRCLAIDLEGNPRITQKRSRTISPLGTLPGENPDGSGVTDPAASSGLVYHVYKWPTEGGTFADRLKFLDETLTSAREAGKPFGYVRIDSLFPFVGMNPAGENVYQADHRNGSWLNALAEKHKIAILATYHCKKDSGEAGDWVKDMTGSMGFPAAATALMYLERVRGSQTGVLHVTAREMAEAEHAMTHQDGLWSFATDVSVPEARRTGAGHEILFYLRRVGRAAWVEIVEEMRTLGISKAATKKALQRLRDEKIIETNDWYWSLCEPPSSMRVINLGDTGDTVDSGDSGDSGDADSTPEDEDLEGIEESERFPAIDVMRNGFKKSRMHPIVNIRKADRETEPWNTITRELEAGVHHWYRPAGGETFEESWQNGWAVTLDRNGSYPSACSSVPVAPNKLIHTGSLDAINRERAGVYWIETDAWLLHNYIGTPLGRGHHASAARDETRIGWFTDAHLELLTRLGRDFTIMDSWTGNRNCSLFEDFYKETRIARDAARPDETRYKDVKFRSSVAIRSLFPRKMNSPFWRPDWYIAIVAQANVRHWIKANSARDDGETLLSMDNTDAVTFWTDSEDPLWLPVGYTAGTGYGEVKITERVRYPEWALANARKR